MDMENKVVLTTRNYKAGYTVKEELVQTNFEAVPMSEPITDDMQELIDVITSKNHVIVKSAYTPRGDYIGNNKDAHYLIVKKGIKPEKANPTHNVCSIGFCEKEQKWYGWSHRDIYGFGIGSKVKKGDCCASSGYTSEYLAEHPEDDLSLSVGFVAKDLIDAKRMAISFASSVS
uniref:Uncharacterized protein n=1 Tax=viral metagenome TaxID=1070528 RepID=A0A6M3KYV5_9ZZZZ